MKKNREIVCFLFLLTAFFEFVLMFYFGWHSSSYSINISGLLITLTLAVVTFVFLFLMLDSLSVKSIMLYGAVYKFIVFILVYIFTVSISEGFYLNYLTGDDRHYVALAIEYSWRLGELFESEKDFYGLPYAAVLTAITSLLGDVAFFRVIQVVLSVAGVYYFYKFLQNTSLKREAMMLGVALFALNPMLSVFASFLFKDTIVLLLVTLLLYLSSKKDISLIDLVMFSMAAFAVYFFRPFLVPIFFMVFVGVKCREFRFDAKKIPHYFFITLALMSLMFLMKDQLLRNLEILNLMEHRVSNVLSNMSVSVELSFKRLLAVSVFSMIVPPPNLVNFETPWFVQEQLVAYPRIYNMGLFVLMVIGLLSKQVDIGSRRLKGIMLTVFVFLVIGMALTGQVLSDRHKLMLYPFVTYFSALAFNSTNFGRHFFKCLFGILALLIIQCFYYMMRFDAYEAL